MQVETVERGETVSPYAIDGPAVISFSGGRTSGLMLQRIIDEGLRPDVYVLFANTGKEREETLVFVRECERRMGVPIVWVERPAFGAGAGFKVVKFETASRNGEPFEQLITERGCLPNPAQRWCTQELKIRVMKKWMQARGYQHFTMVVGIRADEPRRLARGREQNEAGKEPYQQDWPLGAAGGTLPHVLTFWREQPFDLQLRTWEGNCDICFLKHVRKRERIAKDRPDLLAWWVEQERRTGQFFRLNEPDYATLPLIGNFFDDDLEDLSDGIDCHCTD